MDGGTPPLIAPIFWFSRFRRHSVASKACSGCVEYALTARLMPPMVT